MAQDNAWIPDDLDDMEQRLRRGTDAGDAEAMTSLGWLLELRGKQQEALTWYSKAWGDGNARAMRHLWILHARQGNLWRAEIFHQSAVKAGDEYAKRMKGELTKPQAEQVFRAMAEPWYRKMAEQYQGAAEVGDGRAMARLGELHEARGETHAAEDWYLRAAMAGDPIGTSRISLRNAQRVRAFAGKVILTGLIMIPIGIVVALPDSAPTVDTPTCDGETMGAGDTCIEFGGGGGTFTYEEEMAEQERERAAWNGDNPTDEILGWGLVILGIGTAGYGAALTRKGNV